MEYESFNAVFDLNGGCPNPSQIVAKSSINDPLAQPSLVKYEMSIRKSSWKMRAQELPANSVAESASLIGDNKKKAASKLEGVPSSSMAPKTKEPGIFC